MPALTNLQTIFFAFVITLALDLKASVKPLWPESFSLVSLEGKRESRSASDFQGQPLLVQFWASWCRSCSGISSELEQIVVPYQQSKPSGLQFLSVSIDETTDAARETVERYKSSFLVKHSFHDMRQDLRKSLQVASVPTIVLVDRHGTIVMRKEGHLSSREYLEMKQALAALIAKK